MSEDPKNQDPDRVPTFTAANGEVTCLEHNGEVVAKYDAGELTIKRGYSKYRDAIEAAVEAADNEPGGLESTDNPEELEKTEKPRATKQATKQAKSAAGKPKRGERVAEVLAERETKPEGVIEEGKIEMAKYADDVQDDLEFAVANKLPEPPKKNPQFGDKTPAYVDWLKEYRPDKYAKKFGVERYSQRVPVHDESGNVIRHEIRDIASRKTHTTEKIERDPALDESMDWNA